MNTAENIAIIGDADSVQYGLMLNRAENECICRELDTYNGVSMFTYTFQDGSKLQACQGYMHAIKEEQHED